MKRVVVLMILLCMCLMPVGITEAREPKKEPAPEPRRVVVVTADKLNLRTNIGPSFPVIQTLKKGEKLVVVNEKLGWLEVFLPDDSPCWVSKKFVEVKGEKKGVIKTNRVNVRSSAITSENNTIGQLNLGTEVTIIGEEEMWYKITPLPYLTGWVNEKYTKYWGDYAQYKKELDEERAKQAAIAKKQDELKQRFEEAEKVSPEIEDVFKAIEDNPEVASKLLTPEVVAKFEKVLESYKAVAKESLDKKIAATAKQRRSALEPRVSILSRLSKMLVELEEKYKDAQRKGEEIKKVYDDLIKQLTAVTSYIATGMVEHVGRIWNRPGTHRLVKGGEHLYFLLSPNKTVDLNKFYGKQVGIVKGSVIVKDNQKVILIESEDDIKELGGEE